MVASWKHVSEKSKTLKIVYNLQHRENCYCSHSRQGTIFKADYM
jgi:hypothetical protein